MGIVSSLCPPKENDEDSPDQSSGSQSQPLLEIGCEPTQVTEPELYEIECDGSVKLSCIPMETQDECYGHSNLYFNKNIDHKKTEPEVITWESNGACQLSTEYGDNLQDVVTKHVLAFEGVPHSTLSFFNFTPHENPQLFGIDKRAVIYSWRRDANGMYSIEHESAPYLLNLILEKEPIEFIDEKVRIYIVMQIIVSVQKFQHKGRVYASDIGLRNVGLTRQGKVLLVDFDTAAEVARMAFKFGSPHLPYTTLQCQVPSVEQKRKTEVHEVYKLAVLLGTILTGKMFVSEVQRIGAKSYFNEFAESEVPRRLRRLLVRALGKRNNRPGLLDFLGSVKCDPRDQELLREFLDSLLYESSYPEVMLTRDGCIQLELERVEMSKKTQWLAAH